MKFLNAFKDTSLWRGITTLRAAVAALVALAALLPKSIILALLLILSTSAQAQTRVAIEAVGVNLTDSILFVETLLDANGFDADIVSAADIDTSAEIGQYDVVLIGDSGSGDNDWNGFGVALEDFVANGGGFLASGWVPWYLSNTSGSGYDAIKNVLPVGTGTNYLDQTTVTPTAVSHPITDGLSSWTTTSYSNHGGSAKVGSIVLATDSSGNAAVVVWDYGLGRAVHLSPNYLVAFDFYGQQPQLDGTIPDALDLFLNAIAWAAGDGDGDGVNDDDNCPEVSNVDQLNTDGDLFGDACDLDDDNDGVDDDVDNCPIDANVDQEDFDDDGTGDVCDDDVDGDGVTDAGDQCLLTVPGVVVDDSGCSIAQICPANDDWKNHGAYVKCVAHAAEDFLGGGLITEAEKDAIVSEAGQSDIGKK